MYVLGHAFQVDIHFLRELQEIQDLKLQNRKLISFLTMTFYLYIFFNKQLKKFVVVVSKLRTFSCTLTNTLLGKIPYNLFTVIESNTIILI